MSGPDLDAGFFERLATAELPQLDLGPDLELVEWVGEGGMGVVYRGWDRRLERTVAVKLLSPRMAGQPERLERLAREARALAQLQHPHAVQVFDFVAAKSGPYIVMEWVDGSALRVESLPTVEACLRLVRDAADAVAALHDRGWIHRDLKPDNLLVDRSGKVKVTDFGIAFSPAAGEAWTGLNQVLGTPAYMAPELLAGDPAHPGVDVYALGVVLRAGLQGAETPIPEAVQRVVARATAVRPTDRFRDAGDLRDALDRLLGARAFDPLPDEYRSYLAATAVVFTLASACGFWAAYLCFQPVVLDPGAVEPLLMGLGERLDDGRVVVRARFRVGPILLAGSAWSIALVALGGLQFAWRRLGLRRDEPDRALPDSRRVLALGAAQLAAYALIRGVLRPEGAVAAFIPVVGGLVETLTLFWFWRALIELRRIHRPLRQEWRLGLGLALALVPPVHRAVSDWWAWSPPI